jgi:hypothetical protein
MSVSEEDLVAGRRLPDEEVAESMETDLMQVRARMRQRTLFEYSAHEGRSENQHNREQPASAQVVIDHLASIPWGNHVLSGKEVEEQFFFFGTITQCERSVFRRQTGGRATFCTRNR